MSSASVQGQIHVLEDTKTYGQKGFQKRLLVLEQDNGRFVNYIPLEFISDACSSADELSVGDEVEVAYKLSGRKWQRDEQSEVKYFLSAEVLSFKKLGGASGGSKPSVEDANATLDAAYESDDDVPF
jgi:hypothetical protein